MFAARRTFARVLRARVEDQPERSDCVTWYDPLLYSMLVVLKG
jgi:hypothetical protein